MDLSKSYEFFQPDMLTSRVHIIGCGAIGSTVAENLARFGITKITLYDYTTTIRWRATTSPTRCSGKPISAS